MARKDKEHKGFLSRALSATGDISAKRLTGFMLILACVVCMIWLTVSEGGTMVVESLLQTSIITGCSLLGLSSVTSIWRKGKKVSVGPDYPPEEGGDDNDRPHGRPPGRPPMHR